MSTAEIVGIICGVVIGKIAVLYVAHICKHGCSDDEPGTVILGRPSAPADIEAQPTTTTRAQSSTRDYPQFASSTSYGPGVVHVPVDFTAYSPERTPFTRAQIQAMNVDELKILKQKLNMG